jgi:DNA repair protein RecN (Recombination protein N)
MLQKLVIKNYAIIDHLALEPDAHLNIVTGETGAGKSIILGALSLILGDRADTSVLINKQEKCVVEAHFNVEGNVAFKEALLQEELDDEGSQCIIRREISASGKSRAFINDTPVTLAVLNQLTAFLVDLQQQFGHLALEDNNFQMQVVDAVAQNASIQNNYKKLYYQYKLVVASLNEKRNQQAQWQKESDYKQFLLDELHGAALREDELEQAEAQLKQLSHAERIISALQAARYLLDEGEQPVSNEIKKVNQQLQQITEVLPGAEELYQRLNSVHAEVKDIASELEALEGKISLDPEQMQQLQDKLDIGYKLLKKHGVQTTNELLAIQHQLEESLKASLDLHEEIAKLTIEEQKLSADVLKLAQGLSATRHKAAPGIAARINELLALVGMPNASFKIQITALGKAGANGIDEILFLLDANKSGQYLPIYKTASGGEMSRIMLCIKSLVAKALALPTLIFDEVDTGISGEAARQVAVLLQDLSKYHQVICITHQPQVAAKGTNHLFVYKELDKTDRVTTRVRALHRDERILAIAQMIGGEKPSDAALQNARELVTK